MSVLSELIAECAVPLNGAVGDYDKLIERVGDARFVLLGEGGTAGANKPGDLRSGRNVSEWFIANANSAKCGW